MAAELHEHRFRAMGSDCHLVVVGGSAHAALAAIDRVRQLESHWSRFLATSEISRLTARHGEPVRISDDTALLLRRGIEAWSLTGGLFDPTVLGDMVRAGYDRDLAEVVAAPRHGSSGLGLGCPGIVLERDVAGWTAALPRGAGFDPGGLGKGLAADLVTDELLDAGATGVCVNLGGDVRVAGDGPSGDGWTVDIEHPHITEPVARVGLRSGAVATSTTLLRRWTIDGEPMTHVVDPRTGRPTRTDVALVTVVAGRAWLAEVLATACMLRGWQRCFDLLDGTCQALAVHDDGTVSTTDGFAGFTRRRDGVEVAS
ncbi:MAG: FAD:protein FMN transferase [Ilumatobacteraceae bacterium]